MKSLKLFVFGFVMLFLISLNVNFILAQDQSLFFQYNSTTASIVEQSVSFSSVLVRLGTPTDSSCKYSTVSNTLYSNMVGLFDLTSGKVHEKSFVGLSDGIYKYYFKCKKNLSIIEPAQLEVVLRVNSLVSAHVVLSKDATINAGKVDVKVSTSKPVSQAPSLSYSFDALVYHEIPLFGSSNLWQGYLVIPKGLGEATLSFRFQANDLEGRLGTEIKSGGVFFVDTLNPGIVEDFQVIGEVGRIRLKWHFDDDLDEVNIYKSEDSNPDYIDFYKSVDKDEGYVDIAVDTGKTYYYRVALVDRAGNEGEFSEQAYATVLASGDANVNTGLALELRGIVDNFIIEIDSTILDINQIKSSISQKSTREKSIFDDLRLQGEIDSAISELNNVKRDAEKYKLQDLSLEELNRKLDSARLRVNVIKKRVPESVSVIDELSKDEIVDESLIQELLLRLKPDISDKIKEKSVLQTRNKIDEANMNIRTNLYVAEITYLDGTRKDISIIKRMISATMVREEGSYFIEKLPEGLTQDFDDAKILGGSFNAIDGNLLTFSTDVKEIIYSFEDQISLNNLEDISVAFVSMASLEEINVTDSKITGLFFLDNVFKGYWGIGVIVLIVLILIGIGFYFMKNKFKGVVLEISKKIKTALIFLEENKIKQATEIYNEVRLKYASLNARGKKRILKKVTYLHNEIIVFELERGLRELELKKDLDLFKKLEKLYKSLSEEYQKSLSTFFEKVKKDVLGDQNE
ncbi:hypothetical protein GOV14_01845 [Candidatus Pacearchaeota archaeon]|nr:hypothetical protein [Candidatus Pacearchaeota archaeon]